jgi:hypothetical protein
MAGKIIHGINMYQYKNGKWVLEVTFNNNLIYLQSSSNLKEILREKERLIKEYFNNFNDENFNDNNLMANY